MKLKFEMLPIWKQKISDLIIIYESNKVIFKGHHENLNLIKSEYKKVLKQNVRGSLSDQKFKIIKHLKMGK